MTVSEAQHIKDQIRDNQENLNSLPVVAKHTCDYIDTRVKNWRIYLRNDVISFYKILGTRISRRGFGDVIITPRIISDASRYITNNGEAAAFFIAHKIIKQGIMIGYHTNHKDRSLDTISFAAPVEINGKRGNMAVVVKIAGRNLYKTHRILTPDGNLFLLNDIATT
jgi:hypothetical protein